MAESTIPQEASDWFDQFGKRLLQTGAQALNNAVNPTQTTEADTLRERQAAEWDVRKVAVIVAGVVIAALVLKFVVFRR